MQGDETLIKYALSDVLFTVEWVIQVARKSICVETFILPEFRPSRRRVSEAGEKDEEKTFHLAASVNKSAVTLLKAF